MKTAIEVLDAFESIRRAQRAGVCAPHKPLLILLALARVQRGEPRMVEFTAIDALLKQLLLDTYFPATLHADIVATLGDLGVFTVEPAEHRVVFSQHAIGGGRGMEGELQFHGRAIHAPQRADLLPAPEFLAWNTKNVFKTPARQVMLAGATPRATRR